MLRTNWQDEEIKVRTYLSLTGDFVQLGTTVDYPFQSGGTGGAPVGWTQTWEGGTAVSGNASWTTGSGRCSIANNDSQNDIHAGNRYGIQRDFAMDGSKAWSISFQCRTTQGRSHAIRWFQYAWPASTSYFTDQMWSQDDWEDVCNVILTPGQSSIRVRLLAAPYTSIPTVATSDLYWGIQFQNFSITTWDLHPAAATWKELTCETKQFSCHYGRDKFTERYNTATAEITLDNATGEFAYGNANNDGIRPGRFVRATMELDDGNGERPFYHGMIDHMTDSYDLEGHATVVLSCVDTSTLLANVTTKSLGSRETTYSSSARFRNTINSVQWNYDMSNIGSAYPFTQQTIVSSGRTIRDEIGITSDSEGGYVFSDRAGTLWFRGRNWPSQTSTQSNVTADLIATPDLAAPIIDQIPTLPTAPMVPLRELVTDWSRDRIVNILTLGNQNSTSFTYENYDSQTKYGPFTYQRLDFVNVEGTATDYLALRASDYMAGYSDPILRVNSVSFRPSPDAFLWAATVWLNDLVRTRYEKPTNGWGYAVVSHVQGFTHTLTPTDWSMSVALDHPESFVWYQSSDGAGWDEGIWDVNLWDEFGEEGGYWDSGEVWGDLAYLTPSVSAVVTAWDGAPLPNQFTIVAMVDGPVDTTVARMIAAHWESDPWSEWYFRRFGVSGFGGMAFTATGNNADAVAFNASTAPVTNRQPQIIALSTTLNNGTNCTVQGKIYNPATFTWGNGTTSTGAIQTPRATAGNIRIGQKGSATNDRWDSRIYWVELRTGLDPTAGTVLWRFDAAEYPGTGNNWTDARGRNWGFVVSNPSAITKPATIPNAAPVQIWGR